MRAVRTWIMESLNGIRENSTNIMTNAYRNKNHSIEQEAKDAISIIDNFKNEVNMAVTGNIQPRLSKKTSADLKSLVDFDLKIIEKLNKIAELSLKYSQSNNVHLSSHDLASICSGLTSCRNYFRERTKYIGGIKNV